MQPTLSVFTSLGGGGGGGAQGMLPSPSLRLPGPVQGRLLAPFPAGNVLEWTGKVKGTPISLSADAPCHRQNNRLTPRRQASLVVVVGGGGD